MSVTFTPPSADWLSGAYLKFRGTKYDNILTTIAEYSLLYGYDGQDTLTSTHNQTNLEAGPGNDTLQTKIDLIEFSQPTHILVGQSGGSGTDSMTIEINVTSALSTTTEIGADGGKGHDTITVTATVYGYTNTSIAAYINGGRGNDIITSDLDSRDAPNDSLTENYVSGGQGNDTIDVTASSPAYGVFCTSYNEVWGGQGMDDIQALASVGSNSPLSAENYIYGEGGVDTILATVSTGSNASNPSGLNYVDGGSGNDDITTVQNASNSNSTSDATNDVLGGAGMDTIVATITASAETSVYALNTIDGGTGDDSVTATIVADSPSVVDAENRLFGQNDDDVLSASIDISGFVGPASGITALNVLDGGYGHDTLTATVIGPASAPDAGHSELSGGTGDDILTVIGGNGNILIGGNGNDELVAGIGDDTFTGGQHNDVFAFDVTVDQGTEIITDFNGSDDGLRFVGLTDSGATGLADDLDAISTIVDFGTDVAVTFVSGTVLILQSAGNGSVASFADLVDDPVGQFLEAGDVFVMV